MSLVVQNKTSPTTINPLSTNKLPVPPQSAPSSMPPPTPSTSKPTYASRAAVKPQNRVDNILHVYSTHDSKVPISNSDWHLIEQYTLKQILSLNSTSKEDLLVARSGYDAAHQCGFIAAESVASAEWHKSLISSYQEGSRRFRAWAKGEHPTLFLLRVFLPARYNIISPPEATKQLKSYNPFLVAGTFELQREEAVSDGRALFYSINRESFLKIRETYKLNFPLAG